MFNSSVPITPLLAFFQFLVACPVLSVAAERIPNADLEVAVRQKVDQKVEQGVHLLRLQCLNGACSLTVVSLNQCNDFGDRPRFFVPGVERTSTQEGTLKVIDLGGVLQVEKTSFDMGGKSAATLRIGYARSDGPMLRRVTSFSGGFIKNSTILKKVLTVEYIPLHGAYQYVTLNCAVMLPGVEASPKIPN